MFVVRHVKSYFNINKHFTLIHIYQPCQMLNYKRKLDYQTHYVFEIIMLAFAFDQEQQGIPVSQQKGGSWTLNRIPDNNIKCKLGEEFRL